MPSEKGLFIDAYPHNLTHNVFIIKVSRKRLSWALEIFMIKNLDNSWVKSVLDIRHSSVFNSILPRIFHTTCFSYDGDFDLAGILELFFNLGTDVSCHL